MNWLGWTVGAVVAAALAGWMYFKDTLNSEKIQFLEADIAERKSYEAKQTVAIASLEADKKLLASSLEQMKFAEAAVQQAANASRAILGQIGQVKAAINERIASDPASDVSVRSDAVDWLRGNPPAARGPVQPAGPGSDSPGAAGPAGVPEPPVDTASGP